MPRPPASGFSVFCACRALAARRLSPGGGFRALSRGNPADRAHGAENLPLHGRGGHSCPRTCSVGYGRPGTGLVRDGCPGAGRGGFPPRLLPFCDRGLCDVPASSRDDPQGAGGGRGADGHFRRMVPVGGRGRRNAPENLAENPGSAGGAGTDRPAQGFLCLAGAGGFCLRAAPRARRRQQPPRPRRDCVLPGDLPHPGGADEPGAGLRFPLVRPALRLHPDGRRRNL